MYFCENNMEEVLDALIVLDEEMVLAVNHQDNLVEKEDLTKARRQVTAAKAREARQKKQIAKLEERIWALEGERDQLIERLGAQNEENTP
jgi:50S ribosomal subunit-associated GTPase HflX